MSKLLSRLKKITASIEEEKAKLAESDASLSQEPSAEESWLCADNLTPSKTKAIDIKFHTTVFRNTPVSCLVWAKYGLFKGVKKCFVPAHIIPHVEGILETHVPNPIPGDEELVEFLGMPDKTYKMLSVKKSDIFPYNAALRDSSKIVQTTLSMGMSSVRCYEWSPSYLSNLERALREKYRTVHEAREVYDNVLSVASKYLRIASEAMINEQQWEKAHAPPEDEEGQGGRLVAFDMDEVALKYTDEKVYVRAGDSVCYNHKLMKDRGLMTSKIVSVRGDSDIVLENGDYLAETDLVKVIPQEESSHTPSFRQLNEHVFVVGHSRTPIQDNVEKEKSNVFDMTAEGGVNQTQSSEEIIPIAFDLVDNSSGTEKEKAGVVVVKSPVRKSTRGNSISSYFPELKRKPATRKAAAVVEAVRTPEVGKKRTPNFEFHSTQSPTSDDELLFSPSSAKKRKRMSS